ncbi:sigma-70 family RNA polymerase sigma factor [Rhodopirellula sp. MGV]|uniref:sigma-70 family RNA polymerase sigma factor n=1 Tax=Rhodopirellula sp. MGV TaxID=2023130 RepID=UPI000B972765|nr:sigma-70 family RNA polymerase sigma factor [Rhodopirellula sp. MGV]OYP31664.1 hypothetical protein CGZ80_20860 [Rhodopirellula sp. MGV]PNY33975.1 hypothetical protein C2E31_25815 [Rhodopirellula baltica]
MNPDPEQSLQESWSIGRLRPWLQLVADRELPPALRGRVEASDIVQQSLLKAWQGESNFRGTTHQQRLAWLKMILRNTIRDQYRRECLTQSRGEGDVALASEVFAASDVRLTELVQADIATASTELVAAEESLALANALEKLPEEQRRVITMRHFDQFTFAEIASELEKSDAAVRMLWVRALRNLQQIAVE